MISPCGSSPLTRGKPRSALSMRRSDRLIPAHAGKTPPPLARPPPSTAHPRSRGENVAVWRENERQFGSSPLTRGKPADRERLPDRERLIPAHAGKTASARTEAHRRAAHPRSRGENRTSRWGSSDDRGSSPLTRGKLGYLRYLVARCRLIPAHAGKTIADLEASAAGLAHPRSRGENHDAA